jgi:menaquinone-dependent protoporphyrinogen oxidase
MKKILVAYATRAGSTAEVAGFIGQDLADRKIPCDVEAFKDVDDIAEYDMFFLGTPVRAGQLMPEFLKFLRKNKAALAAKHAVFFITCLTMSKHTAENWQKAHAYLAPAMKLVKPVSEGLFGGKMDYSKLGVLTRFMIKRMKIPEGDYREWEEIRTWVDNVLDEMKIVPEQEDMGKI